MTSVNLSPGTSSEILQTQQHNHQQQQQQQKSLLQGSLSPHHSPSRQLPQLTAHNLAAATPNDRNNSCSPTIIAHYHKQNEQEDEQNIQHHSQPHASPLYALPPPLELSSLTSYTPTSSQLRSLDTAGFGLNAAMEFLPPPPAAPATSPLSTVAATGTASISPTTPSSAMLYSSGGGGGIGTYLSNSYNNNNNFLLTSYSSKSNNNPHRNSNVYLSPTNCNKTSAGVPYLPPTTAAVDSRAFHVVVNEEDTLLGNNVRRCCPTQQQSLLTDSELDAEVEAETETEVISSEAEETEDADAEQDDETDVEQINHDTDGDADGNQHAVEDEDSEDEEQYVDPTAQLMLKRQRQNIKTQQSGGKAPREHHTQHPHEKYVKLKAVNSADKQASNSGFVSVEDGNSTDSDVVNIDTKSKLLLQLRREGGGVGDILKMKGIGRGGNAESSVGSKRVEIGVPTFADDELDAAGTSSITAINSKRRNKKFTSSMLGTNKAGGFLHDNEIKGLNLSNKHELLSSVSTTEHRLKGNIAYNKNEQLDQQFLDHLNFAGLSGVELDDAAVRCKMNNTKINLGKGLMPEKSGSSIRCLLEQSPCADTKANFNKTKNLVTQIIRDAFKKSEQHCTGLFSENNDINEAKKRHIIYGRNETHADLNMKHSHQQNIKLPATFFSPETSALHHAPAPNLTAASELVPVLDSHHQQQNANNRDWVASQLMYLQMLDNQASTWSLRGTVQQQQAVNNHLHTQQDLDELKNVRRSSQSQNTERDDGINHDFKRKAPNMFEDSTTIGSEHKRANSKLSSYFNTNIMNFINQEEALELARTHLERFLVLSFEFLQNATMTTLASLGRGTTMALPFDNPISRGIEQDVEQNFINNQQAIKCMVGTVDSLLEQCQTTEYLFQRALGRHQQLEANTTTNDALALAAAATAAAASICPIRNRINTLAAVQHKSKERVQLADDDDEDDEEEYDDDDDQNSVIQRRKVDVNTTASHHVDTLCKTVTAVTSSNVEVNANTAAPVDYSAISPTAVPPASDHSQNDSANNWIAKQTTIRPRTYGRLRFAERNVNEIEQFILRNATAIKVGAASTPLTPSNGGQTAMQFYNQNSNNSATTPPAAAMPLDSPLPLGLWCYEHINTLFKNQALSSAEIILECAAYTAQVNGNDPATAVTAVAAEISQVAEAARIAERAAVAAAAHVAADPNMLTIRLGMQINRAMNLSRDPRSRNLISTPLTHSELVIGEGSGCANSSSPTQPTTFAAFQPPPTPPPSSNNSNSSAAPSPAAKNKRKSTVARRIEKSLNAMTAVTGSVLQSVESSAVSPSSDISWNIKSGGGGGDVNSFLNRPPSTPAITAAANVAAVVLRHQQQLKQQSQRQAESMQTNSIGPAFPTLLGHRNNKLQYILDDANTPPAVLRDRALAEIIKARLNALTVAAAAAGAGVNVGASPGTRNGAGSAGGIATTGGVTDVPFDLSIGSKTKIET